MCAGCYQNEVQGRGRAKALWTGLEFTITLVSWQNGGTSRARTVQRGQEQEGTGQGRQIAAGLRGERPHVLGPQVGKAEGSQGEGSPASTRVGGPPLTFSVGGSTSITY